MVIDMKNDIDKWPDNYSINYSSIQYCQIHYSRDDIIVFYDDVPIVSNDIINGQYKWQYEI